MRILRGILRAIWGIIRFIGRLLLAFFKLLWSFMVIFSFVVNVILVAVLLILGVFIFEIKNNVAQPLIGGLHSTAVGLHDATIDWTIPVRDNIPVNLDIQLDTVTTVKLVQPVPLQVNARIDLPGINAYNVNAVVNLELPTGLELPVQLNVPVPVRERLDVALDVRAVIPLSQTQLADPIDNLGLLFEPLAIALHNLPSSFDQAVRMAGMVFRGEPLNLFATDGTGGINPEPYLAWQGYSRTAGLNYTLFNQPVPPQNQPLATGIVPLGGIPLLDAVLPAREALYQDGGTPAQRNALAVQMLAAQGIPPVYYNGDMADFYRQIQAQLVNPSR